MSPASGLLPLREGGRRPDEGYTRHLHPSSLVATLISRRNRPGIRSRSSGRFPWVAGEKPDFSPACPGSAGASPRSEALPGHAALRSALPRPPGDRGLEVVPGLFLNVPGGSSLPPRTSISAPPLPLKKMKLDFDFIEL